MAIIWADINNGVHRVTCTGSTVSVYDMAGKLLAKFRDIDYGYLPAISPDGCLLAVKGTGGRMAVYDLHALTLVKKFRYSSVDASQDDNFCFSPDSRLLLNIERLGDTLHTVLSVYRTEDLSLVDDCFGDAVLTCIDSIEYDEATQRYYLMGFLRDPKTGVGSRGFTAWLDGSDLRRMHDMRIMPQEVRDFYCNFINFKQAGFTKARMRYMCWPQVMAEFIREPHTLAELWRAYDPANEKKGIPGLDLSGPMFSPL